MMTFDQWKNKLMRLAKKAKQVYIVPCNDVLYSKYCTGMEPDKFWCIILARKELHAHGIVNICLDKMPAVVTDVQQTVEALVLDTLYWEGEDG